MRKPSRTAVTITLLRFAAVAALSGAAGTGIANEERVSYVEAVRCNAGGCEAQHKTIAAFEVVRARDAFTADFCVEHTRRLTGFKTVPSIDPAVPIQVPQIVESERRYFRCGLARAPQRTDSLASLR